MITSKDKELLNFSIEDYWADFIIDERPLGALKGYKYESDVLTRYITQLKKNYDWKILTLGDKWAKTNVKKGKEILTDIISSSIPYTRETLSETESREIANRFISSFPPDSTVLTTGLLIDNASTQGLVYTISGLPNVDVCMAENSIGKGFLFAAAVVVYDENIIGIFCKCESD